MIQNKGDKFKSLQMTKTWTEKIQIQLLVSISADRKLLTEVVSQLPVAELLGFLTQTQCMLGNLITGNVRRHDEDGVFTLDGLPLPVRETPLSHVTNAPSARSITPWRPGGRAHPPRQTAAAWWWGRRGGLCPPRQRAPLRWDTPSTAWSADPRPHVQRNREGSR